MIDVAKHAIASVLVVPHLTVRQALMLIKAVKERLVLAERLVPSGVLASRSRHAELLIVSQVNAFS